MGEEAGRDGEVGDEDAGGYLSHARFGVSLGVLKVLGCNAGKRDLRA